MAWVGIGALAVFTVALTVNAASLSLSKKIEILPGPLHYFFPIEWASRPHAIAPARDGGYFAIIEPEGSTNALLKRLSALHQEIWTISVSAQGDSRLLHTRGGDVLLLDATLGWGVSRVSGKGEYLGRTPLESSHSRSTIFFDLQEWGDAFLLLGYAQGGAGQSDYLFVRKVSSAFQTVWERQFPEGRGGAGNGNTVLVPLERGEYLLAFQGFGRTCTPCSGIQTYRIREDGGVEWYRVFGTWDDKVNTIIRTSDGGYLFGITSVSTAGERVSFGNGDLWLLKINSTGDGEWQRLYGGNGYETLVSVLRTEDGGFLISGFSNDSGVTGNKGVDGDGMWVLKLGGRGLKEHEMIFPIEYSGRGKLLWLQRTYALAGDLWVRELNPRRRIVVNASSTGVPFRLDVSLDLENWNSLVSAFDGTLVLTEDIGNGMKFYRAVDTP